MSRGFHEQVNTSLRTAIADLFDFSDGWTLLGCFAGGERLSWMALPGVSQAITDSTNQFVREGGTPLPPVTTAGYDDPSPEELADLHGIAEVHFGTDEQGRFGFAKAIFDDGWWHRVNWRADEAAPEWELVSPPEIASSDLSRDQTLPGFLAGILHALDLGHRLVGEDQWALSTALRDLIADCVASGSHAVFIIVHRDEAWEAIPANDLGFGVGVKVASGMSVTDAVAAVAGEFAADRPAAIPSLRGVGTIVHYNHDDGSTESQLVAICDQHLHAASWMHGTDRPDWQILPVAAADPDYWLLAEAYTQLLEAIRGTSS
jgi:hypothetical protein